MGGFPTRVFGSGGEVEQSRRNTGALLLEGPKHPQAEESDDGQNPKLVIVENRSLCRTDGAVVIPKNFFKSFEKGNSSKSPGEIVNFRFRRNIQPFPTYFAQIPTHAITEAFAPGMDGFIHNINLLGGYFGENGKVEKPSYVYRVPY